MGNFTGFSRNFEMSFESWIREQLHFLRQIFIAMVVELISAMHIPEPVLMINIF